MADGLRQRWFAWSLVNFGSTADLALADWKHRLFAGATGTVLEIGAGAGVNAKYLRHHRQLMALEPNLLLHPHLLRLAFSVSGERAEQTTIPDESVDTVISSLVLCSVENIDATLAEVRRVLKPGGTYRFIEHVAAAHGTWLHSAQQIFAPICRCLEAGCQPNCEIAPHIHYANMEVIYFAEFTANVKAPLIRDFICGILRKPMPNTIT